MRMTWYGHAAFLVETGGLRVILDPYRSPDSGGYAPIDEPADLVVVSHENDRYHSHLGQVVPPFEVIRAPEIPTGGTAFGGLRFESIPVFETPEKRAGDEVAIVHSRSEGLHLASLGDLGHPLDEAEIAPIRGADVLLVAVGGPPTIRFDDLGPLLDAIAPRLIVPMHYKIAGKINLPILPLADFLAAGFAGSVEHVAGSTIELSPESLPRSRTIVCLEPAR